MHTSGSGARFVPQGDADASDGRLLARAIERAKGGDWSALHFLYVRYADQVHGYVLSIVRDSHEAQDVTQNVFAKLMTAIGRYEKRDVAFTAWLLRVARNAAIDHLRQRRHIPVDVVREGSETSDRTGFERSRALKAALEQIPQDQREVLVLRHIAGLSPAEIADRLDKSEGAVHGLHHRGRGALRAALEELGAAPVTAA